ncbi:hypothetical protein GCM10009554_68720 [Kribbella koreensis]|uniref:ESAT-6 protein secretion system EspG family protein n=1 Tax=Kribbella koreensis TaxID=57909 RepID=A0ABN1RI42_9ACTN
MHALSRPAATDGYAELLGASASLASTFGLMITRAPHGGRPSIESVLTRLKPYLIQVDEVQEWPGTRLADGLTSPRHLYRLSPDSLEMLVSAASSLFDWAFPDLPESLHLLRADGSTVLATVPWHNDAWLELTGPEYETLRRQLPESTWRVTPTRDTTTFPVLTDELLNHLLDLSDRGDPGPWTSYVEDRNHGTGDSFIMVRDGAERGEDIYIDRDGRPASAIDLDLIAAARTYLPVLVKELQRLRSQGARGA